MDNYFDFDVYEIHDSEISSWIDEKKKIAAKIQNKRDEYIKKHLNISYYKREYKTIEIDGYVVKDIEIDEYNNIHKMVIPELIPIHLIKAFVYFIYQDFNFKKCYKNRTCSHFLIELYRRHSKKISKEYLNELMKISLEIPLEEIHGLTFNKWYSENKNYYMEIM